MYLDIIIVNKMVQAEIITSGALQCIDEPQYLLLFFIGMYIWAMILYIITKEKEIKLKEKLKKCYTSERRLKK